MTTQKKPWNWADLGVICPKASSEYVVWEEKNTEAFDEKYCPNKNHQIFLFKKVSGDSGPSACKCICGRFLESQLLIFLLHPDVHLESPLRSIRCLGQLWNNINFLCQAKLWKKNVGAIDRDGHTAVSQSLSFPMLLKNTLHIRLTSCFLHPCDAKNNSEISYVCFNFESGPWTMPSQ